ncbi:MAG: hypothetical protein MJZ25_03845 [Fibrobacter sp.]|nr:hypothetical protein [Fibrobacter sp.]
MNTQIPNANASFDDFLTINAAPVIPNVRGGGSANADPNQWRPRVSAKHPGYDATIRVLPQGIEGLKNNLYPGVNVKTHRLAMNGVFREVKCRMSVPGVTSCPICADIWNRYDAVVKLYGKKDERAKELTKMLAREEWYTNVLIRQDDNEPNNNGLVKVWRHSDAMDRMLRAPFDDSAETTTDSANAPGSIRDRKKKEKRRFIPHSPTNGVDFTVMVTWDEAKGMPTYEGSEYEDEATPLAGTNNEMIEILNQCHDLTKYLEGVPTEQEAAAAIREFWEATERKAQEKADAITNDVPTGGYQQATAYKPAVEPRTTVVDASQFLGTGAPVAPTAAPAPAAQPAQVNNDAALLAAAAIAAPRTAAPAAQPMANQLPPSSSDDDELPF